MCPGCSDKCASVLFCPLATGCLSSFALSFISPLRFDPASLCPSPVVSCSAPPPTPEVPRPTCLNVLRQRWRWRVMHRCAVLRARTKHQSNISAGGFERRQRASIPSLLRGLARFARGTLVKWAIIPVGEPHDDFWQPADPAPTPDNQRRKRGHAATCAILRRKQAASHYGGKHERRKREEERAAKGGLSSTDGS